jgi:membrane-bound metal-dependent hydrolase YbcI (DUF457 family)
VLARSHILLAVAPYLALLSHPVPPGAGSPWGSLVAPVLGLPEGIVPADPVLPVVLSVLVVGLASLAPDLDHARGKLGRVTGVPGRVTTRAVGRLLGHRGPLHSAVAAVMAGVVAGLLGTRLGVSGLGLLVGYGWASHVLVDLLTDRGVPLLWPLWRRRVRLPYGLGPATGGSGENVVVALGLLAAGGWVALGALV